MRLQIPASSHLSRAAHAAFAIALCAVLTSCGTDLLNGAEDGPALPTSSACSPACTGDRQCFQRDGEPSCLVPDCGTDRCSDGASCVDGQCEFTSSICSPACGTGQHCVFGNCIEDYDAQNVCGPLRECRGDCGTDLSCLTACEEDQQERSQTCGSCLSDMEMCESTEDCSANAYGCCTEQFCECFPDAPGCGNTLPCDECAEECDSDQSCLQSCIEDTPVCANCLEPYDECRESNPDDASCNELACDCLTDCT